MRGQSYKPSCLRIYGRASTNEYGKFDDTDSMADWFEELTTKPWTMSDAVASDLVAGASKDHRQPTKICSFKR